MARPRTYDKDLRDKLVEETANRLAEGPAENLGLRDLTKSVGTSTNAVYSLFGAKEVLVWEAIRKILGEKRVEIEKISEPNPRAMVAALGKFLEDWASESLDSYLNCLYPPKGNNLFRVGVGEQPNMDTELGSLFVKKVVESSEKDQRNLSQKAEVVYCFIKGQISSRSLPEGVGVDITPEDVFDQIC